MNSPVVNAQGLPAPLDVRCTDADCERDLHCFKANRRQKKDGTEGRCRSCGAELIDWPRVHERRIADAPFTFECLRHELVRHVYWHVDIDDDARHRALKKGRPGMVEAIPKRLMQSVGSAEPFRDGMQTPKRGNLLYYAQHATASCCRTCINYWHGIPKGRDLTAEEIAYLGELVLLYVDARMPELAEGQTE
jgi:ribosomal protein L34E